MLTALPDLAKSFAKMKLMLDLRDKTDENTIIGYAIILAIDNKKDPDLLIASIKSQAKDNPSAMENVIGPELTKRILAWQEN